MSKLEIYSYIQRQLKNLSEEEREEMWNNMSEQKREDMLELVDVGLLTEDEVLERELWDSYWESYYAKEVN